MMKISYLRLSQISSLYVRMSFPEQPGLMYHITHDHPDSNHESMCRSLFFCGPLMWNNLAPVVNGYNSRNIFKKAIHELILSGGLDLHSISY